MILHISCRAHTVDPEFWKSHHRKLNRIFFLDRARKIVQHTELNAALSVPQGIQARVSSGITASFRKIHHHKQF